MPVYRAENGTWLVRWRDAEHRQRAKRGFPTKKAATEYLAAIVTDSNRGDYVSPSAGKVTVEVVGRKFLATRTNLKPSTRNAELNAWKKHVHPRWGMRTVGSIQTSDVTEWISDLTANGLGATATLRALGILSAILQFAVDDRKLNRNPASGLRNLPQKVQRAHIYLTHTEVEALATASGQNGTIIRTLAYTGLRWGELAALKVEHLDFLRSRINVVENAVDTGGVIEVGTPKTHERRSVPMPRFLIEELSQRCGEKQPTDLVFPARTGGYMRRPNTNPPKKSWFITAKAISGVPERLTIHELRNTAASLAISSGANVKAVQRMLGHKSASMTLDVYADLFDTDLEAVAERMSEARAETIVPKMFPIAPMRAKNYGQNP